jgi:hypothetical protein
MQRLKEALENLDLAITNLEDQVGSDNDFRREAKKKDQELLKLSRARETGVLAMAQKLATRLDQTIDHVENIVRN